MHAFRWSTFSLLLAQKIPTSKNLFPTPSTKVILVSPPYLPLSFVLFQVCLSCYIVLSIPLNENVYAINFYGKSWLYSSHKLDAHFTFTALNTSEPLWLKLWSYELDNSLGWELAHMCCHIASFQHCTYLYLVDVMYLVSLLSKYKWLERLTGKLI